MPASAPSVFERGDLVERRGDERVDRAEMLGDNAGGRRADVMNAQPGQHAGQAAALWRLDAGEQVVGLLFAHAFEREHGVALAVQREDVAERIEQAGVGQLVDDFLAHAFDVHLAAAGEVDDPFAELGRALRIDAVAARFVGLAERLGSGNFLRLAAFLGGPRLFALDLGRVRFDLVHAALVVLDLDFAAALGAFLGRRHRSQAARPLVEDDADDLRNDLARLLDDHRVADADVLAADFAQVVERGVLHRRAGDEDRLHVGPRRELARFADLPIDADEFRDGLLGRVFVGDAPAREFAGVAELLLQVDAIDADDDAVDRYGSSLRWAAKSSMNCHTSSIVSHCWVSGLVGIPQAARAARNSLCVSNGSPVISPRPWATMLSRRSATMRESSCLSVPAVALRGLANGSSPAATTALFMRSNSAVGM